MNNLMLRKLLAAYPNQEEFLKVAETIIEEEEKKENNLLARDLRDSLYRNKLKNNFKSKDYASLNIPCDHERGLPLFDIKKFDKTWEDIILDKKTSASLERVIQENEMKDILIAHRLKPRQKLLFFGPPGCGKTLAAQVLCGILNYPMVYIRFDGVVSSYLGETSANMRKIFDFISMGQWIVLFDEFDIIGKQRDSPFEHGEMKRVVNNLLQMIDNYSGESIIICATNHQHLLDPALWRRFDEVILFDLPNKENRIKLIKRNLRQIRTEKMDYSSFADSMNDMTPADIETICINAIKKVILDGRVLLKSEDLMESFLIHKERLNRKKEIYHEVD